MRIGEKPEIAYLPLFRHMDDIRREEILAEAYLQVFPPQLTLFEAGQNADFLYVLVDGLAELYAQVPGARRPCELSNPSPASSLRQ